MDFSDLLSMVAKSEVNTLRREMISSRASSYTGLDRHMKKGDQEEKQKYKLTSDLHIGVIKCGL